VIVDFKQVARKFNDVSLSENPEKYRLQLRTWGQSRFPVLEAQCERNNATEEVDTGVDSKDKPVHLPSGREAEAQQ